MGSRREENEGFLFNVEVILPNIISRLSRRTIRDKDIRSLEHPEQEIQNT